MTEILVKTMKRGYIRIMPKHGLAAASNLAEAFKQYNEWYPHNALGVSFMTVISAAAHQ